MKSSPHQSSSKPPMTVHFLGNILTFRARFADTAENFTVIEMLTAPGAGSPPHTQTDQEAFLVLEGEYEIMVGDKTMTCGPNEFIHVPPGTMHMFRNPTDKPSKMLLINFPGDLHENFFLEVGEKLPSGSTEFPAMQPPDAAKITATAAKFGIIIPPPPGQ